jgi:hypothetical protein
LKSAAAVALLSGLALLMARPASADISLEGAAAVGGGSSSVKGAGAVSFGLINVPLAPVSAELTYAARSGGGYAATVDARLNIGGTTLGTGAGYGTLGGTKAGTMYDALIAHGIFPHTALEARWYFGPSRRSTLLAGIRISF